MRQFDKPNQTKLIILPPILYLFDLVAFFILQIYHACKNSFYFVKSNFLIVQISFCCSFGDNLDFLLQKRGYEIFLIDMTLSMLKCQNISRLFNNYIIKLFFFSQFKYYFGPLNNLCYILIL